MVALVVIVLLAAAALMVFAIFRPCDHAYVYPGRDSDTGVYYYMCAGCRRVSLARDLERTDRQKWVEPAAAAALFRQVA